MEQSSEARSGAAQSRIPNGTHKEWTMLRLLVAVDAKPGREVTINGPKPVQGFTQTLGVTARSHAELDNLVRKFLQGDLNSTLIEIYEMWEPDFSGADRDIKDRAGDQNKIGVWYASGRAWYWDNDDNKQHQ